MTTPAQANRGAPAGPSATVTGGDAGPVRGRFPLRAQLLLVLCAVLVVPWFGYGALRAVERQLRGLHADSLVTAAATLAAVLAESPAWPRTEPVGAGALFVHPLAHAMQVDGYVDDWREYLEWADAYGAGGRVTGRTPPAAARFRLLLGEYEGQIYALVDVSDPELVYSPVHRLEQVPGDRVDLVLDDPQGRRRQLIFATAAPGRLIPHTLRRGYTGDDYQPVTNVVGEWQPAPGGYRLEIRIPAHLVGRSLGVVVTDVRAGSGASAVAASAGPDTLRRPGRLLRPSVALTRFAAVVAREPGRRVWALDAGGAVLASAGTLRRSFAQTQRNLLYELVLPPASEDFTDDRAGASRLRGDEVRAALAGRTGAGWHSSADERAVVVTAAAPVGPAGSVRGVVVVEETTGAIQMLQRRALAELVDGTLIALAVVTACLLGFAARLSYRLRRLSHAADKAIDGHGRVVATRVGDGAADEIGDLGRSFSVLLGRLRQYHDYLEGMARRLAHELRTPIAVVRSSLDNLDGELPAAGGGPYLARAREGVERLDLLVNRLFEASRLEQALAVSARETVDLVALVLGCVEGYRGAYPGTRFESGGAAGPLAVSVAPDLVVLALDKLVANAVDFGAPGEPVAVRVDADDTHAVIEVCTRGAPLPAGLEEEVFNSMVSARPGDGDREPHLGLGLYIVRLVAEFHGGRARARNRDDGVCVSIALAISGCA
ncbi:MAG: hypothetical protein IT495_19830 [Gammaproteobacteria bacterium]|nr:hypothetical protein [Gammaproteobacteria bacterium]